jgi:hypothetical protein
MSTKFGQSMYRRRTNRGDESVAPSALRVEYDTLASVIFWSDPVSAPRQNLVQDERLQGNNSNDRRLPVQYSSVTNLRDYLRFYAVSGDSRAFKAEPLPVYLPVDASDETARVNPSAKWESRHLDFEGVASAVLLANAKDFLERSPTPSESVDAYFVSLLDQRVTLIEAKSSIRSEAMHVVPRDTEARWKQLNERRLRLIDKDIGRVLTEEEKEELIELEKKAGEYMNRFTPLPFGIIDRIKACAAKEGLNVSVD